VVPHILDVKNVFTFIIIFIKNAFVNLLFFERFLFLVAKVLNSTVPAKLWRKTTSKWWISHCSYRKFSDEEP